MLTVAVIIPCWNQGRLLGEALASVALQTVAPAQVIVVDDGSTDETAEVASADPHVTVIRQDRKGTAAARNAGMARAKTDLIAFLDADDLLTAMSLELRIAALRGTASDGCFGVVEEFRDPVDLARPVRAKAAARLAGASLVTRAAAAVVGAFDESLPGGEVVDWVSRFDAANLCWTSVPEVVLRRRVHDANKSRHPRYANRAGLLAVARRSAASKRNAGAASHPLSGDSD